MPRRRDLATAPEPTPKALARKPAAPARPSPRALPPRDAFFAYLTELRPEIERRLAARWSKKLEALAHHGPDVLTMAAAARDLTLRGGKRYRAALLAIAYGGVAPAAPIEAAL